MGRVELDGIVLGSQSPSSEVIRRIEREVRKFSLVSGG
jgi:hypothetical protein